MIDGIFELILILLSFLFFLYKIAIYYFLRGLQNVNLYYKNGFQRSN